MTGHQILEALQEAYKEDVSYRYYKTESKGGSYEAPSFVEWLGEDLEYFETGDK